jgi:hypothetical protein
MGMGVERHIPVALPPVKAQYPVYRRLVWSQGQSGRVRNTSTRVASFVYKYFLKISSQVRSWKLEIRNSFMK